MQLEWIGDFDVLAEGTEEITKDLDVVFGTSDKKIMVSQMEEGFSLNVKDGKAELGYHSKTDFYRGFTIAVDALKKGYPISVSQKPSFETCGVMLDVSRGAVPKVERIKELLRRLARMGFNEFLLYTEDTYELKAYPYFGYMRGRYTEEELKEIVSYGEMLGIEIMPCIQTLGHLASALRWPAFDEVRDQPSVLMIDEEKTYQFIETMIQTVRRCYKSNRIHIGMDEAHGVGLGAYYEKYGPQNRFEILTRHLNKVVSICKKYDLEPLMWSDMFFRLGTKNGGYYSLDVHMPENISEMIPDGVSQVYWDYYNNSENMYRTMIREHNKMGCPIVFAGGLWTWSAPSVNLRHTFECSIPALKVCREQGIHHVITTVWRDDGCECDLEQALYGMQYYAEYNYNPEHAQEKLDEMFRICNGFDAELFRLLDIDDFGQPVEFLEGEVIYEDYIANTSKQALYQNPLLGLFDANLASLPMHSHYAAIAEKLSKIEAPEELYDLFETHKQLVKVLVSKCDFGIRIKAAYDAGERETLQALSEEADVLANDIARLKELRMHLWFQNNKPFGYELLNDRLVNAESHVRIAKMRLEAYLSGEVTHLEELEETRLSYNGTDNPLFTEYWARNILKPMI